MKEELKQYFSDGVLDSVSAKLALNMILRKIDEAPTVAEDYSTGYQDGLEDGLDDIRPKGKWIAIEPYNHKTFCPFCKKDTRDMNYDNFCPNCGADMRESEENE